MKKTVLSTILLCTAVVAMAQPAGGFGGFQIPEIKLETSQEWKDVNYAGDDQAYHTCDIYLPKQTKESYKQAQVGTIEIDLEGQIGNHLKESSMVNAACDWSGPVDLTAMDCGEHITMGDNSPEDVLLASKLDKEPDKYLSLSATNYVDSNDPPIIIFHGEKDNVVPGCQGKKFFELLKAAGVKTEATFPAEGSHGGPAMYTEENLNKMVHFLEEVRINSTNAKTKQ